MCTYFHAFCSLTLYHKDSWHGEVWDGALAQTIVQYFIVVINFGLDISAVKDVSVHRNDKLALNRIVSTVLFIKLILFCFVLLCY